MPLVRKVYCHPALSRITDESGETYWAVAPGAPTRIARSYERDSWLEEEATTSETGGTKGAE